MANTKVTGDLIASLTIATGNIANNAITSDKISGLTTAHITEGANLYYTDARARAAVSVSGNALSYNSSTGVITSNFEESPTFTGIITASSSSSGDYVRLYGSSGTGKWDIYGNGANLRISDNESAGILVVDTDATFGGEVSLKSRLNLQRLSAGATTLIQFKNENGVDRAHIDFGGTNEELSFFSGAGTVENMRINSSGVISIGPSTTSSEIYFNYNNTNNKGGLKIDYSTGELRLSAGESGNGYHQAFYTNGTEKMRIDSSGNLSLATATSLNFNVSDAAFITAKESMVLVIDSDNNQTGRVFQIKSNGVNGDVLFSLGDNGQLGLGTTSPEAKLSISGLQAAIDITRGNSGDSKWEFSSDSTALYFSEMSTGTRAYMMTIKETTGNVGIGTTSPDYNLEIEATDAKAFVHYVSASRGGIAAYSSQRIAFTTTGSSDDLVFGYNNGATATSANFVEHMRIDNGTGNVGIGTTSPGNTLDVAGDTDITGQLFVSHDANYVGKFLNTATSMSNDNYTLMVNSSSHTSNMTAAGAMSVDVNSGRAFTINGIGRVSIGGNTQSANTLTLTGSATEFDIENTSGKRYRFNCDTSGNLRFEDKTGGTEVMRFASSNNVGIGTTSPSYKLDVGGYVGIRNSTSPQLLFFETGSAYTDGMRILRSQDKLHLTYGWNANEEALTVVGTGSTAGYVGINTTSPTEKLHVEGRIRLGSTPVICSHDNIGIDIDQNNNSGSNYFRVTRDGEATELFRVQENGNVGIGTTTPYSKLAVYGALTVGPANQDPAVTLSEVGNDVSLGNGGGSVEINMPIQGTTTNGCTLVFKYAAASWKSWILDYEFASTDGMVKGVVGGYNNGSTGHGKTKMLENFPTSVAVAAAGSGNQHVQVTFTFSSSMGVHPFARFKYSQGGGDGTPRADRISVVYNEGS